MFKKNNKNNEEVIEMEQTTFIQRHAKKIMIAGGIVVGVGVAYLLKKHDVDLKIKDEAINNLIEANEAKDKEIGFIKFLVVEGDIVPKALQNAENKLARKENKIQSMLERLANVPDDMDAKEMLEKTMEEAAVLREQIFNTLKLNELIVNDENIYTK